MQQTHVPKQPTQEDERAPRARPSRAAWTVAAVLLTVGAGMVLYRLLHLANLDQSAAFFVGMPALMAGLAAFVTLSVRTETLAGIVFKALTIAMLASLIVFSEGIVCVVFAAPLVYLVGMGVVGLVTLGRRLLHWGTRASLALALLPALLLSTEGVLPDTQVPALSTSLAERVVDATPDQVEATLSARPRVGAATELPLALRLGFPRPVAASGSGLAPGDRRVIDFASRSGRTRSLVLEVDARGPNWVRFKRVSDATKIAEWLDWQTADVQWSAQAPGTTRVRWTFTYRRRLDPAWYFGPLESVATTAAADYLITAAAAPVPAE